MEQLEAGILRAERGGECVALVARRPAVEVPQGIGDPDGGRRTCVCEYALGGLEGPPEGADEDGVDEGEVARGSGNLRCAGRTRSTPYGTSK